MISKISSTMFASASSLEFSPSPALYFTGLIFVLRKVITAPVLCRIAENSSPGYLLIRRTVPVGMRGEVGVNMKARYLKTGFADATEQLLLDLR